MARYTLTHDCGHQVEHQLVGKETERQRRLAWLKTADCHACYKAAQAAALTRKCAEVMGDTVLPELTGTPKQIAWAIKLRQQRMTNLPAYHASVSERVIAWFVGHTEARWWIDNKDMTGKDLSMIAAAELGLIK